MKTGFILRFDDLCPTVNWDVWNRIEELLVEFDVKPILSVIPDNRDKALIVSRPGEKSSDKTSMVTTLTSNPDLKVNEQDLKFLKSLRIKIEDDAA